MYQDQYWLWKDNQWIECWLKNGYLTPVDSRIHLGFDIIKMPRVKGQKPLEQPKIGGTPYFIKILKKFEFTEVKQIHPDNLSHQRNSAYDAYEKGIPLPVSIEIIEQSGMDNSFARFLNDTFLLACDHAEQQGR